VRVARENFNYRANENMKNCLRNFFFLSLLIACSACSYASPSHKPLEIFAHKPILNETSLDEPLYRDAKASMQLNRKDFGIMGAPSSQDSALALKAFDTASLREVLKFTLEDSEAVESIRNKSCYSLVARIVDTQTTTHPISSLWNTVHGMSMTWILGVLPYGGSLDVMVQLRVYKDGTLIGKYSGTGNSTWRAHGNPFKNIPRAKLKAFKVAAPIAVKNAVATLVDRVSKNAEVQGQLPLTCNSNLRQVGLTPYGGPIARLSK
jgi:hypothetical protein